jgi:biopolymer transport protein ExbD
MKFRKKKKNRISSIICFVPLLNVIFLLLFLSSGMQALAIGPEPLVGKGLSRGMQASAEPVGLSIFPGKLVLNGHPLQKQDLASIPAGKKIIISISPEITYGYLADILGILRTSGHTNIYFATNPIHD